MSRDPAPNVPPELRAVLEQEADDTEAELELEKMWGLAEHGAPPDEALPEADSTWAEVRGHIEKEDAETEPRPETRSPRRPASRQAARSRLWSWGSAVAVVLLLVIAGWWSRPIEVTAVSGTTVDHTLPDGSTVELHGDTRLIYPRTFAAFSFLEADRRVVRLQGEAYFEVESGERPFVVQTSSMHLEVVGTAFSVRSRPGERDDAYIALVEGRLRVNNRVGTGHKQTLYPGEVATLGSEGTLKAVRDTSIERITAWRRGGFAVTARPLPGLTQALERRFGRPVRLDASISPDTRSTPMTLYYSQGAALETILNDVSMARGLTYRATARGYVLMEETNADDPQSPSSP